jgi:hypothetical protein
MRSTSPRIPEPPERLAPPLPLSRISTTTVASFLDSSTRASEASAYFAAFVRLSATT